MYLFACGLVLAVAAFINRKDSRMLALTLMVGASIQATPPMDSRVHFYLFCILTELAVMLFAFSYEHKGFQTIGFICIAMIICHLVGFFFKGGLLLSPYRLFIPAFECLQLFTCVALSRLDNKFGRAKHATTI